jgi:hypothetical protein
MAARQWQFGRGSLVWQEEVASLGSLVGRGSGADGERQQWSGSLGGAQRGNSTTDNGSSVRRRGTFSVEQREKREGQVGEKGSRGDTARWIRGGKRGGGGGPARSHHAEEGVGGPSDQQGARPAKVVAGRKRNRGAGWRACRTWVGRVRRKMVQKMPS